MTQQNEAIRLAVDLMEQCYAVANTKDFANRYTAHDAMNDLSAAKTLASQAIKTLRPLLDQTSAGAGDPLDPDMKADELRLHMGELTADEVRVARAAIRWANSRALSGTDGRE